MRSLIEMFVWMWPASAFKNRVLNQLGRHVAMSARISPVFLSGVREVRIGERALVGSGNVFRGLSLLRLDDEADYGSWNWASAHPGFQDLDPCAGTLFVGYRARMGSRCYIDASGTVIVQAYASIGGNRCLLQSHAPDFRTMEQTVGRIVVGHHSLVATQATMLCGARLPAKSTLAAGGRMMAARPEVGMRSGLYVGNPARFVGHQTGGAGDEEPLWMTRTVRDMTELRVADTQGVSAEDVVGDPPAVPELPAPEPSVPEPSLRGGA